MKEQVRSLVLSRLWPVLLLGITCCGDGTAAQRRGVGAECANNDQCQEGGQTCLPFKGGYCGIKACTSDAGCPQGSACIRHDDGINYCFLVCAQKADCNVNRSAVNEANCSSTAMFVGGAMGRKACSPPSG